MNDLDVDAQACAVLDHGVLQAGVDPAFRDTGTGFLGPVEQENSQGFFGEARGGDGHGEDESDGVGENTALAADDLLRGVRSPAGQGHVGRSSRAGCRCATSGADVHHSQALIPPTDAVPPIRSRCGPGRRRPGKLHGDKAHDHRFIRAHLRRRRIPARIARRGVDSSQRLGRHRWVIERTVARLGGFRRLHRRYERNGEHVAAFASIAAAAVCLRRIPE
ncbi:hypothetical protein CG736_02680 [Kitasatospora sp. CB02891]|nr:hypothetical protein CG736_02680 [Kitasatospora sp. CB02891]